MANPLHPDLMTPAERLDEVARLLALGFLRLRARREQKCNDPNHLARFGLDFGVMRDAERARPGLFEEKLARARARYGVFD